MRPVLRPHHAASGGTVLVLEDDDDVADVVSVALRGAGHRVVRHRDGVDAVAIAAACSPDVVLVDLGLPHLDGMTVCENLRCSGYRGRVVVMSGRALDGAAAGMVDGVLAKPFSLADLREHVQAALEDRVLAEAPA